MNGEYVMTEDGPKWHEQAEAVVKYVLENQSLDHLIDADGYTDTVASVSINLYGFVNGVKDCLRQASEGTAAKSSWSDGTFSYEAPEFDSNGYKDQVSMTVKDGKMTALTWDLSLIHISLVLFHGSYQFQEGRPYFGNLGHAGNRTKHMPADEHGSRGTFNSAPEDQNEEKGDAGSGQDDGTARGGKDRIQREMFYLLFRLRRRRKGRGRSCGGALPGAGRKRADQQHWNRDRCPYGAGNRGSVLFR